jgi:DNA-binding MarR family transcriptional regulator
MASRSSSAPHTLPPEDHAFVAVQRSANSLALQAEQVLKHSGITGVQYNVLRILRGAEPGGLACRDIGERMISHDPDMTRLLDRLEKSGFITRQRQTDDRRVVKTRVTQKGLDLLRRLDAPIHDLHKRQFRNLSLARLKLFAGLLRQIPGDDD